MWKLLVNYNNDNFINELDNDNIFLVEFVVVSQMVK